VGKGDELEGELKVYGVDGLCVADASTIPRVTTGNTTLCVLMGEHAAPLLQQDGNTILKDIRRSLQECCRRNRRI
jgi:choline dehydrogenase-like flavoprotein